MSSYAGGRGEALPWWLVLVEGIVVALLGLLLLVAPGASLFFLVRLLGIYLLIAGIFRIIGIFLDSSSWGWKLAAGILCLIAGLAILSNPLWSTTVSSLRGLVIFVGFLAMLQGAAGLIVAFQGGGWGMGALSVLGILLGLFLVINPLIGVAALTFILAIFMLIGGVGAVVQAFRMRREAAAAQQPRAGALGQATSEKLAFRDCPKRVCRIVCCSSDRVKETSCEGNHIMAIHGNWHRRRLSRRDFLSLGGMSAAALALGSCGARPSGGAVGYGPLVQDPAGILDLPSGFQYRIISEEGSTLSNGAPVPGAHDGMAAFPGAGRHHHPGAQPRTTTKRRVRRSVGKNPYRSSQRGGTTGIVVGPRPQGDKGLRHLVGHPQQLRGRGDAVGYLADLRGDPQYEPRLRLRGRPEEPREQAIEDPDPGHGLLLARSSGRGSCNRRRVPHRG